MDIEERDKVCRLIEAVISADGVVTDAERDFLHRVIQRFGLPARDGSPMSRGTFGETTTTLRALPADVQLRVMALLVEAACVDGRIDPQERALLLASGAALGIDATVLEERITSRLRTYV